MTARYWFKPKRFGYGATPVTWEGWALTVGVAVVIAGSGWLLFGRGEPLDPTMEVAWVAVMVIFCAASVVVSKVKTEGSWRWRWGDDR